MIESGDNFGDESMGGMIAKLRETFQAEAYELTDELEEALLELEKNPADTELIDRVFRSLHTIKGSGAACEMADIASFAHEIETFFEQVRKRKKTVTKRIIDLTLSARDQIRSMFDGYYKDREADISRVQEIVDSFRNISSSPGVGEADVVRLNRSSPNEDKDSSQSESAPHKVTYRIRFSPSSDSIVQEGDFSQLTRRLHRLGHCEIVTHTDSGPHKIEFDARGSRTFWDVILTTGRDIKEIKDVFVIAKDRGEVKIEVIDEDGNFDDEVSYKKLGEILLERGDLKPENLREVLMERKRIGEMLVGKGVVSSDKVHSALVEQQHVREMREKHQGAESISNIRVSTAKLDSLVNLVSELVTVQARLSQTAFTHGITEFLSIAEEVERLTAELRDNIMNIRMLPIGTMFSQLRRVVRDLSAELGKEIELETSGAETELDKTIMERLSDPLVHLIRNSIDHGIESPEVRQSTGKARCGTISLSAYHSGARVYIEISDDGAGLDKDAILTTARDQGLIRDVTELSDNEIYGLILMPGFSTAKRVTNVSGRGVGLDVVKRAIDSLRGNIEITSKQGTGTTITIKLPLTLAIIDGLLTKIGAESYILPLALVEECVELISKPETEGRARNLINVRDRIVPYVRLRDQFHISGEPPRIEQIVITRTEDKRVGIVVDHIVGGHQTVIKNMGRLYREVEGVSGATILGDGTVALILDVPKLVQSAVTDERERLQHAIAYG